MRILFPYTFVLALILILVPHTFTLGHGFGESLEIVEGKYLADIGYDAFLIEAEAPVRFTFDLFSSDDEWVPDGSGLFISDSAFPADFNNLWVRVEEGGERTRTIFATGIQQPVFGPTTMLFSFPNEGTYTMYVRFQNEKDEKIVEVSTPIIVQKSSSGSSFSVGWSLFLALLAGAVLGLFVPNPFKKEESS